MNYLLKEFKRSLKKKAKLFRITFSCLIILFQFNLYAQESETNDVNSFLKVHRELESFGFKTQDQWSSDTLQNYLPEFPDQQVPEIDQPILDYIIYPYWQGRLYKDYDWSKIERFAYFGYIINPEDGYPNLLYSWKVNNVIEKAKKENTKVDLVLFCNSKSTTDAFLESDDAKENCINYSFELINDRRLGTKGFTDSLSDGDGLNVFFPYFDFKKKKKFAQFIEDLSLKLNTPQNKKELIVTFPLSDTLRLKYLIELAPFIDELHFNDYDYMGMGLGENPGEKYEAIFKKEKKSNSGAGGNKTNGTSQGSAAVHPTASPNSKHKTNTNSNSLLNLHLGMQAFGYRDQDQWNTNTLCSIVPAYLGEVLPETDYSSISYLLYPYWQGQLYKEYKWDSIQRVGYFGYLINPEDGSPNLIYSWNKPNAIDEAKRHETEVDLVLFCGSSANTNKFLKNSSARKLCIQNVNLLCDNRDSIYNVYCEKNKLNKTDSLCIADGVNVFFPYFDFKLKRDFGLFIKDLYWEFKSKNTSRKIIVTFPFSDTIHFKYLLGIEKYIDELHFVNYDYRGYNPDESLANDWNAYYKSDKTDLGFFEQIWAEMLIAEFVNPFVDLDESIELPSEQNDWEYYFLAICAIVLIILLAIILSIFWCKFNQIIFDYLVLSVLLLVLLLLEIVFLFFFMVEEMNFDIWLINTNNPNSNFFLLVPIVLIFLFPVIKILQSKRDLP